MLKFFLTFLQYVISIYWLGAVARQNPKIDIFIAQLEGKYGDFNKRLKELPILQGMETLQKLYAWAAAASCVVFLLSALVGSSLNLQALGSVAFLMSFLGWFSIKWCMRHKAALVEFLPQTLFIVVSPPDFCAA